MPCQVSRSFIDNTMLVQWEGTGGSIPLQTSCPYRLSSAAQCATENLSQDFANSAFAHATGSIESQYYSFLSTHMYSLGALPPRSETLLRVAMRPLGPQNTCMCLAKISITLKATSGYLRE